mmetsp:Transcript_44139/g.64772  ORF Transcript_44139/g.64772 Transcript_44139/m.64772 type:complete len:220 (+) Transcript_44139:1259-1918(+)
MCLASEVSQCSITIPMRPGPTISPKTETTCWWLHALVTVSSRLTSFIISEVSSSTFKPLSLNIGTLTATDCPSRSPLIISDVPPLSKGSASRLRSLSLMHLATELLNLPLPSFARVHFSIMPSATCFNRASASSLSFLFANFLSWRRHSMSNKSALPLPELSTRSLPLTASPNSSMRTLSGTSTPLSRMLSARSCGSHELGSRGKPRQMVAESHARAPD